MRRPNQPRLWAYLALLSCVAFLPASALAANARVQAASREVERAKTAVRQAAQTQAKVETETARVVATHRAASNALGQASQAVAKKLSDRLGLPAAAKAVAEAEAEAKQARAAVLDRLEKRADYQAAAQAAKTAGEGLGKLNDEKDLPVKQYEQRSRELTALIRGPLELQRQEESRDAACQAAQQRLQAARQKLGQLEQQYQRLFAEDPAVAKPREELKKADKSLASARQHEADGAAKVASAQARLDAAERAYTQAVSQSHHKR